jgi:hypothetical protein
VEVDHKVVWSGLAPSAYDAIMEYLRGAAAIPGKEWHVFEGEVLVWCIDEEERQLDLLARAGRRVIGWALNPI